MMRFFRTLIVAAGLAFLPLAASAGALDDAKADGLVGERVDGYVGVVPADVPAEVQDLVDQVNDKRRAKYAEVAGQRDVPVAAVASIAGKKLVQRAAPGEYVAGADGRWRRK